jgi:hypothetical protein
MRRGDWGRGRPGIRIRRRQETFSWECVSYRWCVKGRVLALGCVRTPFQGRGCPGTRVSKHLFQENGCPVAGVSRNLFRGVSVLTLRCPVRYLFRGKGVLALGRRGTFSG